MLCPVLYTDNQSFFEKYAGNAAAIARGRCLLAVGIGIATADSRNMLFSSGSLTGEFLEAISKEGSGSGGRR